jgi:hypothetical protein
MTRKERDKATVRQITARKSAVTHTHSMQHHRKNVDSRIHSAAFHTVQKILMRTRVPARLSAVIYKHQQQAQYKIHVTVITVIISRHSMKYT